MKVIITLTLIFLIVLVGCKEKEVEEVMEAPSIIEVEPEPVEIIIQEVSLTQQRTMVPDKLTIKVGESVIFNNDDLDFLHNIYIYDASIKIPTLFRISSFLVMFSFNNLLLNNDTIVANMKTRAY